MSLQVIAAIPRAEIGAAELIRAAASACATIDDPQSSALRDFAAERQIPLEASKSARQVPDEGVVARVGRQDVLVGNEQLLTSYHVELSRDILREVRMRRERGESAILVAADCRMLGAIFLVELRQE